MLSTFAGIEIGKRSIDTHTKALATTGHNISNANVEGYSRQRVDMKAFDPLYMPALNRAETPGQLGQGVETERIKRIKDMMLEGRIVSETNKQGYWTARDNYLLMVEQVYNEPSDLSVRSLLDRFWESWQELSLRPSEMEPRKAVLQRGETLIDGIHSRFSKLQDIRRMLEEDVQGTVIRFNELTREIAVLNEQIVKVEALGDNPNDLLDRRDLLAGYLAELADITINDRDPDEYSIYVGGMHVVQGKHNENLELLAKGGNEGYSDVVWENTVERVVFRGGKLAALLQMRDGDVRDEIQKLDLMTINFIDLVNEIHTRSYGINQETGIAFFREYPFINNLAGNYDRNGDGEYDSSYIFRITGTNALQPKEQIGLNGTLTLPGADGDVQISYFPTDTVEDLIDRINLSGAEVVARLNLDNYLSLKALPAANTANPDFVIRGIQDSGQFLAGYAGILPAAGAAGAFTWQAADAVDGLAAGAAYAVAPLAHPAGWIEINPQLFTDSGGVAASLEDPYNGPGDGAAALAIANLRTARVMIGQTAGFDDYFSSAVAEIGLKGEQAETAVLTENLIMKELKDMRDSISGVNMDEELANMIKFQHGYAAAARFITEIDKMLDIIINRMGV